VSRVRSGDNGPSRRVSSGCPAEKITTLSVFEAIEGSAPAFTCQEIRRQGIGAATPEECQHKCIVHSLVDQADAAWRAEMAGRTVAAFVEVLPDSLKARTSAFLSKV